MLNSCSFNTRSMQRAGRVCVCLWDASGFRTRPTRSEIGESEQEKQEGVQVLPGIRLRSPAVRIHLPGSDPVQ